MLFLLFYSLVTRKRKMGLFCRFFFCFFLQFFSQFYTQNRKKWGFHENFFLNFARDFNCKITCWLIFSQFYSFEIENPCFEDFFFNCSLRVIISSLYTLRKQKKKFFSDFLFFFLKFLSCKMAFWTIFSFFLIFEWSKKTFWFVFLPFLLFEGIKFAFFKISIYVSQWFYF